MLFNIRGAIFSDLNYLIDIDIKSSGDAWLPKRWEDVLKAQPVFVATRWGSPVGVAVLKIWPGGSAILKLAVKPNYRRQGLGGKLLQECIHYSNCCTGIERIHCVVPEPHIYPDDGNLGSFLAKQGFEPTTPFLRNRFEFDGETVDGVRFILPISKLCVL